MFPAKAMFPAAQWDGSSADRQDVPILDTYSAPSPDDWSQITAEMLSMQFHIGAGGLTGPTDTTGYHMIPKVAGAPTAVPANVPAGFLACCYDSTDNKIYVYNGGWKATVALS